MFGDSKELKRYQRVDGAIVNKDLNWTIQSKGGTGRVFYRSAEAMSESLFDMNTDKLYETTGGKKNRRETLPKEAQKAFIVGETVANFELKDKEIEGSTSQKNQQIVESISSSGKKARRLLPW